MGSLDAHKEEIISQLLEGRWETLFPKKTYSNLVEWLDRHKSKDSVVVRFTFCDVDTSAGKSKKMLEKSRYALYLLCNPVPRKNKLVVQDVQFSEDLPLAIPPLLYDKPLYCMSADLLRKMLKKKEK
jgi:hypothetical protein